VGRSRPAQLDVPREAATRALGVTIAEPFMQLSFIALSMIPRSRLADGGLVDVDRFAYVRSRWRDRTRRGSACA
jgi:adenine deaminase